MNNQNIEYAKSVLAKYRQGVNEEIDSFFSDYQKQAKALNLSHFNEEAINELKEFCIGPGKRIRGILAWFTFDSLAKRPNFETGRRLALALELVQNYLLIVDDVMDRSSTRRGQPTIHKKYENILSKYNHKNHLAEMIAINIGLLSQHLANQVILGCSEIAKYKNHSIGVLHENIIKTCYGQIDDLLFVCGSKKIEKETIYSIYEAKSSYYTFINPMQIGAIMSGSENKELNATISNFGKHAGIAFQLKDDLLGMFGKSQETGKSNLDDLKEGKKTLLVYYSDKMLDDKGRQLLNSALGNLKVTDKEHKKVCQLMERCGAKAKVENEAKEEANKAIKIIQESRHFNKDAISFYSGIVDYSISREY